MQRPSHFHTTPTPVASRTRQGTSAAAARAAENANRTIYVSGPCKLALQSRAGKLATPAIQPTPDEISAAIPEHGIVMEELFELFIARLPTLESLKAFNADFQSVAAQDPVDMLIFPSQQSPTTFVSRLPPNASPLDQARAAHLDDLRDINIRADNEIVRAAWNVEAFKDLRDARA